MKSKKLTMLILLFISATFLSHAQVKIGLVNYNELAESVPKYVSLRQELQSLVDRHVQGMELLMTEYREKMNEYEKKSSEWTSSMKSHKESLIMGLEKQIEIFEAEAKEEISKKQEEISGKIWNEIVETIRLVGKENGYTYIFDVSSPIYTGDQAASVTTDLTAKVKAKLTAL